MAKNFFSRLFGSRLAKKRYLWLYIFFVAWTVVTFFLLRQPLNPITFGLTVFLIVLLPGFALTQLTKIKTSPELFDQVMIWLVFGWSFILLCSLIAIVFGLTIVTLTQIYYILTTLIFISALVVDLLTSSGETVEIKTKDLLSAKILVFLLLVFAAVTTSLIVGALGANFPGDPLFHLSILRKAVSGLPLWPSNLSYVKGVPLHIAYGFPIWHVALSLVANIFHISIFSVWDKIILPLTLMSVMAWYWLARNALPGRVAAVLALIFFLILRFFQYKPGYFFTRLPVPDTLSQLFLLPLTVGLALRYIFDPEQKYKLLLLTVLFSLLMALIHLTQYYYYLLIIFFAAIGYLLIKIKDRNFAPTAKKIGFFFLANVMVIVPLALVLELKDHVISTLFKSYWGNTSTLTSQLNLLPFLTALFGLLFVRKYAKASFLVSLAVMLNVLFWGSVQTLLNRILGSIFVNRLSDNIQWNFLFWGLLTAFLIGLFDLLLNLIDRKGKNWNRLAQGIFTVLVAELVYFQFQTQILSRFYDEWLMKILFPFVNDHIIILLVVLTPIVFGIIYLQKKPKVQALFSIDAPKNYFSIALAIFLVGFTVFSPYIQTFQKMKIPWKKLSDPIPANEVLTVDSYFLDTGLIKFIEGNVPCKSIILVPTTYFYQFSVLLDNYMVSYPDDPAITGYQSIYNPAIPIDQKIQLLSDSKAQYVVVAGQGSIVKQALTSYPNVFKYIYDDPSGTAAVFEVVK